MQNNDVIIWALESRRHETRKPLEAPPGIPYAHATILSICPPEVAAEAQRLAVHIETLKGSAMLVAVTGGAVRAVMARHKILSAHYIALAALGFC